MTPEEQEEIKRRRKGRNIALAVVLGFIAVLFYVLTLVKMGD